MKKAILLCSFLFFAMATSFAQTWMTSGGNMYLSPTTAKLGIGTTSPATALDVNGTIASRNGLISYGSSISPGNLAAYLLGPSGGNANIIIQGNAGNDVAFWLTGAATYFMIGGQGASPPAKGAINIDNNGNVGINMLNTSGYTLNVAGTAVFDQVTVKNFTGKPNSTPWADYVFEKRYQLPSAKKILL